MTPSIYVLMCLSGDPGGLDPTADERFWRDEQSCVIVRDKLQKECSCAPFVPGSNAIAIVTVPTHDATGMDTSGQITSAPSVTVGRTGGMCG
jgi:hypothetical protein